MARSGESVATFADAQGVERRARMTMFIEGEVLRTLPTDRELRRLLGAALASLALALRTFDHPSADRDLAWDLRHAGRMRAMLAGMQPSERRSALGACLDSFDAEVVPRLERLPVQVVHNDLSRDNVVLGVDGGLGVIDFGDVVRSQRVNDVAVAMADPRGFLQPLASVARAHSGLLVADEVQAGFARTGGAMWGFQRHGVEPDLVTMGKPMGNGMPIAAVAARPETLESFGREIRYFNTFGGNNVSIAAATAVLDVIEEQALRENAETVGGRAARRVEEPGADIERPRKRSRGRTLPGG